MKKLMHFDDCIKTLCGLLSIRKNKMTKEINKVTCPLCIKIHKASNPINYLLGGHDNG